jgi:CRISPR/Cas system-associated exonuclease Cas4 (RecB family)
MPPDKYTAVWVSHTSISDYLKCPRAYYLNNMYKDPATGRKVKITNPSLALGQTVHEVVESLSVLPTNVRFKEPLPQKFERAWTKVAGIKGGFTDKEQEDRFKKRGQAMLERIIHNPGPISRLAVKIRMDLPHYWLSEEDKIILCGKVDWLEYYADTDAVHIIDFKTGKREEDPKSLQLPIYYLLVSNTQHRQVTKASYWYLDSADELAEQPLPDMEESRTRILKVAKEISLARKLNRLKCPQGDGGCYACRPMEAIVAGRGKLVGVNEYNQDIYMLDLPADEQPAGSDIL